ncbi:MAG: hypothetical protein G01um101430_665 [Parcubacteria group bacterium Gr01-1014_30]|nr:MAG: hypothetical protein G01um101430_665 [Parcubacteria group bacterium Gr01-1014_30]
MKALMVSAALAAAMVAALPLEAEAQYGGYYPTLEAWGRAGGYGYGGYGGYGYGYPYRVLWQAPGVKFHLELVPEDEIALVKRGIVTVNGAEVGLVNRHDGWWNAPIQVASGHHEVGVVLEDGRVFQTSVFVQPFQVLHVYLRFPPVGSQPSAPPPAPASSPPEAAPPVPQAPAPRPAPAPAPPAAAPAADECAHLSQYPTLLGWCAAGRRK